MFEIHGIRAPDTALCQAATSLAQRASEPFLFHHVMRSYVYAEWIGRERKLTYDREILYIATVLHDLGLTATAPVRERFEIEGADLATRFLVEHGAPARTRELVWDAIALHTTAEIPQRKATEIALCQLGIACDLRGVPPSVAEAGVVGEALQAYPWLEIEEALLKTLVGLYQKNPAAAGSHAVADACERYLPGFTRFNLCDVLLANVRRSAARAPAAS
jgi:hypothetical protein